MFAARAVQKPTQDQTPSRAKQTSQGQTQGLRQPENVPESSPPLHRYLGNSYMQAMAATGGAALQAPAIPPIVHEVVRSPGQPLDPATRAFMEPRFGHDFSQVRVHTDTKAAESAGMVNALVYTVGSHVVLGAGKPSPETIAGRQVLAHELAHVVQQSSGGPAPVLTPSAPHEHDAHAAAMAVAIGLPKVHVACRTGVGLARQELEARLLAGRDFIEEVLGKKELVLTARANLVGDIEDGLRQIAEGGTPANAATAQGLLRSIDEALDLPSSQRQLQAAQREAGTFLRRHGRPLPGTGSPPARVGRIQGELERLARREGAEASARRAGQLSAQIERLRDRIRGLEQARRAAAGTMAYQGGTVGKVGQVKQPPKTEPKGALLKSGSIGESGVQGAAKVEQAVVSAEAKLGSAGVRAGARLAPRIATAGGAIARAGWAIARNVLGALSIVEPLVLPGPLAGLGLWVDFASSYEAAWEYIKSKNTLSGFTTGLAASLLGLSLYELRKMFERTVPAITEGTVIVGAEGIGERAFNRALFEGYRFGNQGSREERNALRERSGLAATDKTSNTIMALAIALRPTVERIFEEARKMEKAARQAKEAQEARERYERGESGSMRFE